VNPAAHGPDAFTVTEPFAWLQFSSVDDAVAVIGATFTVIVALPVQPAPSEPLTMYVVVEDGVAVTEFPVVADRPVDGLHAYVLSPEADRTTLAPVHMFGLAGVKSTLALLEIVTITSSVEEQLLLETVSV
jgi:hypothetical protein